MDKNIMKFGYEDTDSKIEVDIYGIILEVKNFDGEKLKEIENNKENDEEVLEKQIDLLLGDGSVEKLNNKRISDGYCKMTAEIELQVIACIVEAYINSTIGTFTNKIEKVSNNMENKMNNFKNRSQKRNYNYNRNRRYRRY